MKTILRHLSLPTFSLQLFTSSPIIQQFSYSSKSYLDIFVVQ
ncbi:hypothetical protein X975_17991, partial [Stegodyphus mimosarum]